MISSRKILIATFLPLKFLGMLCLYIAAKCLNKHVYVIRSDRIGHFVPDSAEAIIRLNKETDGFRRRFVFSSKPANIQWQKMVQRTLPMWPSYLFSERILRFCPFFTPVFHNATLLNSGTSSVGTIQQILQNFNSQKVNMNLDKNFCVKLGFSTINTSAFYCVTAIF